MVRDLSPLRPTLAAGAALPASVAAPVLTAFHAAIDLAATEWQIVTY